MYRALMDNRALFHCHEGVQVTRTAQPEAPLISATDGAEIFMGSFSPNRIEFGVAVGGTESRVVLNQNFANGWRSTAGPVVPDPISRRPSVVLPPGTVGTFQFRFAPEGLLTGLAVFLFAAAAAAAGWIWRRTTISGPRTESPAGQTSKSERVGPM
jgi:hypothetical protein